jgi:hypothetical protein
MVSASVRAEGVTGERHSGHRTLVNPRPQAVRLVLSDGTQRVVGAWSLALLPERAADGRPLEVVSVSTIAAA